MGTRTRFAVWRREKRIFIVKPPDWPKHCEISFTDQETMQTWAKNNKYMLKDGNRRE